MGADAARAVVLIIWRPPYIKGLGGIQSAPTVFAACRFLAYFADFLRERAYFYPVALFFRQTRHLLTYADIGAISRYIQPKKFPS